MYKGIYVGLSGAVLRNKQIDVTAQNLANLNTPGYKRDRLSFRSYLAGEGLPMPAPALYGDSRTFAATGGQKSDFGAGQIMKTGNPLDVALMDNGFFAVQTEAGERYTRKGVFQLDRKNHLVTQEGHRVLGTGGPIVFPANHREISIGSGGVVSADNVRVGQLKIVDLEFPEKMGDSLFAGKAVPVDTPVQQGVVESSNVEAFREMISLIQSMRYFEANHKLIQTFDNMAAKASNELGKV